MTLRLKYLISSPVIAVSGYLFLIFVPYLYPAYFFPFIKVFSFWEHILVSLVLVLLVILARVLSEFPSLKLKPIDSTPIKPPKVHRKWYIVSIVFIYLALLMNFLLVVNGLMSYDGLNFISSKKSIENFNGINIVSQFYLFFIGAYILYGIQNNLKRYKVILLILGVLVFLRSIYYAERLALLEFLVPIVLVFVSIKEKRVLLTKFVKYFLGVLLFFILLELTRQFSVQYGDEDVDVWFKLKWTLERFFAYYGDTQNKFYFALDNDLSFESRNFFNWIERIAGRIIPLDLGTEGKIDFGEYRWRDFTNLGGLTMTYTDFGLILGCFFVLFFFTSFFRLWIMLKKGSLYAWCVYPVYFVWVVEFARYSGVFLTRFVVAFILFNSIYLVFKNVRISKIKNFSTKS